MRGDAAVYLVLTLLAASGCMNGAYSDVVELSISIPDETMTTEHMPTTGTIGDTGDDDGTTSATRGSETESGNTDTFPRAACGYRNRARFRETILFHCADPHEFLKPRTAFSSVL